MVYPLSTWSHVSITEAGKGRGSVGRERVCMVVLTVGMVGTVIGGSMECFRQRFLSCRGGPRVGLPPDGGLSLVNVPHAATGC